MTVIRFDRILSHAWAGESTRKGKNLVFGSNWQKDPMRVPGIGSEVICFEICSPPKEKERGSGRERERGLFEQCRGPKEPTLNYHNTLFNDSIGSTKLDYARNLFDCDICTSLHSGHGSHVMRVYISKMAIIQGSRLVQHHWHHNNLEEGHHKNRKPQIPNHS